MPNDIKSGEIYACFSYTFHYNTQLPPNSLPIFSSMKKDVDKQDMFSREDEIWYTSFVSYSFGTIFSHDCLYIMKVKEKYDLETRQVDRIVEMAWEDRTPFDAIEWQFGVPEKDVIKLMREEMKRSSWRMWRKRVQDRSTKHMKKRVFSEGRHRCSRQKDISSNRISKR